MIKIAPRIKVTTVSWSLFDSKIVFLWIEGLFTFWALRYQFKEHFAGRERPSWDRGGRTENFLLPWRDECRQFLKVGRLNPGSIFMDFPSIGQGHWLLNSARMRIVEEPLPSASKTDSDSERWKISESGWQRTVVGPPSPALKTNPSGGRRRTTNKNEPSPSGEPLLKSWWLSFSDRVA